MASTYVNDLRLVVIASGEQSTTWGDTTNTNLELIGEAFSYGTEAITTNADAHDTEIANGATDPGRSLYLKYTGTLDSTCTVSLLPNTTSKVWIIENATSGGYGLSIKQGSGAEIVIPNGDVKIVYSNGAGSGAAIFDALVDLNIATKLTLKNPAISASPATLLLQSGDTDVAADDVLGKIQFQAPDEASHASGDNKAVAAEIAAISEGDFSETNNATKLSFKTAASEAAAEKMSLSSTGNLTISNDVILDSDSAVIKLGDDQDVTLTHVADTGVTLAVTGNNDATLQLDANVSDGTAAPFLILNQTTDSAADNDIGGAIHFKMENDSDQQEIFGAIESVAKDVTDGSEDGELNFKALVAGTSTSIMQVGASTTAYKHVLPGADSAVYLGADSNYVDTGEGINKWARVHADRVVCGTGTTASSSGGAIVIMSAGAGAEYGLVVKTAASTSVNCSFETSGGGVGSIQSSTTTTTYYTSSDYRLKENVTDMTGAITRVKNLKPKRFNYKIDSSTTVDGFLAHEAAEVVPKAVGGEKDAVKDDGSIDPQQIDHSVMIPLLTGALQEAIAKIEVLESKVAALEAS